MNLIGHKYATFRDGPLLVKAQDLSVRGRLPVACYREALAYRLGTRLGLAIPPTELLTHPKHGRLSVQRWLEDARPPSQERLDCLRFEPTGIRILLLDLLVANADRRDENLIERDGTILPIDFNVAFAFAGATPRIEMPEMTIMRWFGTAGVLALPTDGMSHLEAQVASFEHLISDPYIRFAVAQLPDEFVTAPERERLQQGLASRRAAMATWLRDWWQRTVEPLHRFREVQDD